MSRHRMYLLLDAAMFAWFCVFIDASWPWLLAIAVFYANGYVNGLLRDRERTA